MKLESYVFSQFLKFGILFLGITLLLWNCEKEEILELRTEKHQSRIDGFKGYRPKIDSLFKRKPELSGFLLSKFKKKENSKQEIHSDVYGFSIDTTDVQLLSSEEMDVYTFVVKRDEYSPNVLENYILTIFSNGDYVQILSNYQLDDENQPIVETMSAQVIEDESLVSRITTCGVNEIAIVTWDPNAGDCVNINCGGATGDGTHSYGDSSCEAEDEDQPRRICSGAWMETGCTSSSGGGTGDGNGPFDPANGGGPGNDNEDYNDNNQIPAVPVINYAQDIINCINVGDLLGTTDSTLNTDQLNWVNSSGNRLLEPIREYLNSNLCSEDSQEYIISVIEALRIGDFPSFEYIQRNRTYLDEYITGDEDDNVDGGEDMTQYPFFDPTQEDWPEIAPVIPTEDFIGWGYDGIPENCMSYAKHQIAGSGYQISNYWNNTGQTIQIYKEPTGVNLTNVAAGISYLKNALENEIPVIVGIDANQGSPNPLTDNTTDHFVVIVGMGEDSGGKYFLFFDNATNNEPFENWGASSENKLYYDATTGKITGSSQSDYYDRADYDYLITQIRKSKPL